MLKAALLSTTFFLLCCARLSGFSPGLAADHAGETNLTVAEKSLHVVWSEPRIVAVATEPQPWGYFQFPKIARTDDGALYVKWAMNPDSITAYGKGEAGWRVSRDGGSSWNPATRSDGEQHLGVRLKNGERLAIHTPTPLKASEVALPPVAGTVIENYSKTPRRFYRTEQLPPALQGVYLNRFAAGDTTGNIEHDPLESPGTLRYELQGLLPVVWWGDIRSDRDGSLVAGTYPGFFLRDDGSVDGQMGITFCRSTDQGHSWKVVGKIPYQFDAHADAKGAERSGFTEPAFEILRDGTYLCVLRTTDGAGNGPMYVSRSRDRGATWTKPEVIAPNGVLPRLLQLENGVVVLSAGRPGVQVRFAFEPAAGAWSEPLELVLWENEKDQVSCGYTGLVATGPDRFVIVYSDFHHRDAKGESRKAIAVREFSATPK